MIPFTHSSIILFKNWKYQRNPDEIMKNQSEITNQNRNNLGLESLDLIHYIAEITDLLKF